MTRNRPLLSREYKLMLNTDRFRRQEEDSETFWRMVCFFATQQDGKIEQKGKKIRRRTWYLDTPARQLRRAGFVLRLRQEEEGSHRVTLKFRSSDRYLAAHHAVTPNHTWLNGESETKSKIKFEEDIMPTVRKFAHSASVDTPELPPIQNMKAAAQLFPVLQEFKLPAATPLQVVNGLHVYEVVLQVGDLDYGDKPDLKACLSFWYLQEGDEVPLVGEFSYDYDLPEKPEANHLEEFPIEVVERANQLFAALQRQPGWFDRQGTTKTAYAYGMTSDVG